MKAVVTGASRGIGYETVLQLADKGHEVIATARSEEKLQELAAKSGLITYCSADLTKPDDISELGTYTREHFSTLDILVNNAGGLINKSFEQLTIDDWRSLVEINLLSAVRMVKELLDDFSSPAHIVNISSMGGFQGSSKFAGLSAYSVSKGALCTLSECLAVELADRSIRVNTLCLGAVQTEMLEEAFPGYRAPVTAGQMGSYIADFALQGSTYYNGKVLPVALDNPE